MISFSDQFDDNDRSDQFDILFKEMDIHFIVIKENVMLRKVLMLALTTAACLSVSGCLSTMYVMKKLNEKEYTTTQVEAFSNYGLVACKHRSDVKDNSRILCNNEIQNRLANNKMTAEEYSKYEMNIEAYRQADINAATQRMQEQILQNQAISAQEDTQASEALKPQVPLEVNVHHSL
ncbi:hypothetical protein [Enterobacter hormaechei]|uniref:hypothetical protein n=1 Tax=Enterobacter hormaechei TaxID=158836 RepID=UPI0034D2798A